jgi:mono/diheme cytochrome c family protein
MVFRNNSVSFFVVIICFLVLSFSCKKTITTTTKIAFTNATMKPWFDTNCASCHASGKPNSSEWLYDASNYESTIKIDISEIYREVYIKKSMPVGTSLTTVELSKFKTWYDAGYSAN